MSSLRSTCLQARAWHGMFSADIRRTSGTRNLHNRKRFSHWHISFRILYKFFLIGSPFLRFLWLSVLSDWLPYPIKQITDGDEASKDFKEMTGMWGRRLRNNLSEKVKGLESDVKPQNGLFEPKASYPFCGFASNQISDPLIFLRLCSGAWSTCRLS